MNPNQSAHSIPPPAAAARMHGAMHVVQARTPARQNRAEYLRRCSEHDCTEIHAILSDITEPFRVESRMPAGWTQNILRTALATGMTVWAYERHGIMLGAVCIRKLASASVIAHIAVRPFRRGYGIGGKLLRHAERHAGSPLLVRLDAGAIWTIRFFEKYGYRPVPENSSSHMLDMHWGIAAEDRDLHIVLAGRNCCRQATSKNLKALSEPAQQRDEGEQG